MKLFDKLFNYELQAELSREKDCREAFPVTTLEMEWLRGALQEPSSSAFFKSETQAKIERIIKSYRMPDSQVIKEKGSVTNPDIIPNPCFNLLRQAVHHNKGVRIYWVEKTQQSIEGWPMLLEFNMARREWYLVWLRLSDRRIRFTPLRLVRCVELIEYEDALALATEAEKALAARRRVAVVEINPAYPLDRHRVLSALSAFDRDVEMDAGNIYSISIHYFLDEEEYLLQRIRFLGLRVQLKSPARLAKRMQETVERVLRTYGRTKSE